MPFDEFAPITDTNRLPVVHKTSDGSFEEFSPVTDTNPLPVVSTPPSP